MVSNYKYTFLQTRFGVSLILLLCVLYTHGQYVLSGTVRESKKGKAIIGATVRITDMNNVSTLTDTNGYFKFENIPYGKHSFQVSYIGYKDVSFTVEGPNGYDAELGKVTGSIYLSKKKREGKWFRNYNDFYKNDLWDFGYDYNYDYGVMYFFGKNNNSNDSIPKDYKKAFEFFSKCHYDQAYYYIGYMYEEGLGITKDDQQAFIWYKKAAEKGNIKAQVRLAKVYEDGRGTNIDLHKAFIWNKIAAGLGNDIAQYNLGCLYEQGKGIDKDPNKALYWYNQSANQGNNHAIVAKSRLESNNNIDLGTEKDRNIAESLLKKAEEGDADAQYEIACMYSEGRGVPSDSKKALYWYTKSASQGNIMAQYSLGTIYEELYNNVNTAIEWYRKAAEQGETNSQTSLGDIYFYGINVTKNFTEALKWYKKAAEQEDNYGQFRLGLMYQNGFGIPKDLAEAKRWYEKAANQGSQEAINYLNSLDKLPPSMNKPSLLLLDAESTTRQKKYPFKIGVQSDSKIRDVNVYVNGVSTYNFTPIQDNGYNMTLDLTVDLNDGDNTLKIMVRNAVDTATLEKNVTLQNQNIATIDWLNFPPTTSERKFALKAGIKSTSKIESWTVTTNGIVERGINPVGNDGYSLTIDKMLTLAEGDNTIKIEVKNADGIAMAEKKVTYTPNKNTPGIQQKRIALVIGNSQYQGKVGVLVNPQHDAEDIRNKLQSLGFDVMSLYDGTKNEMNDSINDFVNKARFYDVALFYYAGHGMQLQTTDGGTNYLIPVDAQLVYDCDSENCINANHIVSQLEHSGCNVRLVVLDACRDRPNLLPCQRGSSPDGFSVIKSAVGTYIMYSTREGQKASDGKGRRNSPFAEGMLKYLDEPNLPLEHFFKKVGEWVDEKTNYQQSPWPSGRIRGDFYFNKK